MAAAQFYLNLPAAPIAAKTPAVVVVIVIDRTSLLGPRTHNSFERTRLSAGIEVVPAEDRLSKSSARGRSSQVSFVVADDVLLLLTGFRYSGTSLDSTRAR